MQCPFYVICWLYCTQGYNSLTVTELAVEPLASLHHTLILNLCDLECDFFLHVTLVDKTSALDSTVNPITACSSPAAETHLTPLGGGGEPAQLSRAAQAVRFPGTKSCSLPEPAKLSKRT